MFPRFPATVLKLTFRCGSLDSLLCDLALAKNMLLLTVTLFMSIFFFYKPTALPLALGSFTPWIREPSKEIELASPIPPP